MRQIGGMKKKKEEENSLCHSDYCSRNVYSFDSFSHRLNDSSFFFALFFCFGCAKQRTKQRKEKRFQIQFRHRQVTKHSKYGWNIHK